jgi:glycosyltransferase involved in cell wall biosynthesis
VRHADYFQLRRDHIGQPYTFLWSGTPDRRKGWDVAYRAFCQAFGEARDVQLILHFRDPLPIAAPFADPNVRVMVGLFDRPILRELYRQVDCFVFPSRGEGWGSPPREAAATGLPVIATNYGGLAEELHQWGMGVDWVEKSPAAYGWWEDIGNWVEPSVDQVAARMLWCYTNGAQAHDFGEKAASWLQTNAPWERTARGLLEVLAC